MSSLHRTSTLGTQQQHCQHLLSVQPALLHLAWSPSDATGQHGYNFSSALHLIPCANFYGSSVLPGSLSSLKVETTLIPVIVLVCLSVVEIGSLGPQEPHLAAELHA